MDPVICALPVKGNPVPVPPPAFKAYDAVVANDELNAVIALDAVTANEAVVAYDELTACKTYDAVVANYAVPCNEAVTPAVTCNDPVICKLFVVAYADPVAAKIPPPPPVALRAYDAVVANELDNA